MRPESDDSTDVDEQGPTSDDYTMRLLFPPTDDVTITIAADGQTTVDTGTGPGQTAELVFTASDWETEKTVTVTAVDDDVFENGHTSTITHSVASNDVGYQGLAVANVTVNVADNDCGVWGFNDKDYNQDCIVNLIDLAQFLNSWLDCTVPYGDGCVNEL